MFFFFGCSLSLLHNKINIHNLLLKSVYRPVEMCTRSVIIFYLLFIPLESIRRRANAEQRLTNELVHDDSNTFDLFLLPFFYDCHCHLNSLFAFIGWQLTPAERYAGFVGYDIVAHFPRWNNVCTRMNHKYWRPGRGAAEWQRMRLDCAEEVIKFIGNYKLRQFLLYGYWSGHSTKVIFTLHLDASNSLVSALPRQSPCWRGMEIGAKTDGN